MTYQFTIRNQVFRFDDLKTLFAKANELKSGDELAGIAANNELERCAAKFALADLTIKDIIDNPIIAPESDEVSKLCLDDLDHRSFEKYKHLRIGDVREMILANTIPIEEFRWGITPEVAAALTKIMSNGDLILAAKPIRNITRCRSTMGEAGVLGIRLQPNHPTDSLKGIVASTIDGLLFGCGDAVIGVNPSTDSVTTVAAILKTLDTLVRRLQIPTQVCCLAHVSTQIAALRAGAPVDLLFQSISGTQAANTSFGVSIEMLKNAQEEVIAHHKTRDGEFIGNDVMYFETGQGSALSSNAHHGVDQLTLEARAYGVARHFNCFLVNTVVGFIGPEYLLNDRQITRAGLEDHFMGKLLGLPMGVDVCYTNHADADQNTSDNLLVLLSAAGCNYFMGVPCGDDVMLGYQSTSFHDAVSMRKLMGLKPTPEFAKWLKKMNLRPEKISDEARTMFLNAAGVDA